MDDEELSNEQLSITTIVYSGRFRSYPIEDFKNLGLILKRVNHSVWFGIWIWHTSIIESLWLQIKQITNNFAGISILKIYENEIADRIGRINL